MKTVVITGASRGIGLATAQKFIAEGWKVIGTYLNNPIPIESSNLVSIQFDQSSPESIGQAVEKIKKLGVKIDALINNAGIILDAHENIADIQKIRKTFEVNIFGLINLTEQLLPLMTKKGHIINLDSNYGSFSFPIDDESSTGYRLTKAALNMYTRALAFRLKNKEVIVSSLDPGWVKTDMGNDVASETEKPDREPEQPAEDIYNLVNKITETGYFWKFGKKREW
ncbi:MAG: hypothetical protein A3A96_02065 [Candidatus Zambryskibacteria bacterium RIFCSPLOWO2_01_FULL_39_39]|uniref:Short-chain dehydrogenase n=1 Tax=Candidatus Zambryskibacteria bacterium RIFCSPLOWO2_01_FULL_39_39 TaxID=1802758 RepID=A0A1G2TWH0_9BACT|nr:MAG: hypothetical protein A2644_01045 [Candidatus Zambryskibacteria bacterium RIFCSPHIGHO2_01_FULL_39_63]OHA94539.1 MAG: hypothetical protein A3B88_01500 [Candidatus Zambryskibacteria bacterium RIFCSPHIGHO2_02_FULL_39_19]OHA98374.1 MAG: hypothetical protein A3F20_01705 [Candidatus Zambryskibacteria bacterium RIFCSPHIGHO2_12_FULL_39_21]OHB01509.1 MAG: hypothetical protein A3A96_02065 [Candidatus Zambryskibacteria bacterium RIFCSPLOWO2_01_FULL_39_39]